MAYVDAIPRMNPETLEREIIAHNYHYWVRAQPLISDYAYDLLVEQLKKVAPGSGVLEAVGSGGAIDDPEYRERIADVVAEYPPPADLELGEKIEHDSPMLSLDKCYDEETLRKWFAKFEGDVAVSPKVDGVALSLKYRGGKLVLAATRGDGRRGEVMTNNALRIDGLPIDTNGNAFEVRGEAYMPLSVFRSRYAAQFANPRNLTAGAIKQKDPEQTGRYSIRFFAYDMLGESFATEREKFDRLHELGFETVDPIFATEEELQTAYDDILAKRDEYDFETDGVVYKADDCSEQERMGWTSHHPRYAIAYKFQGDSGVTVMREVRWSVSRTGAINPVAIVDPVELSGATITRISLHNLSIMEGLGRDGTLYLGSHVVVMRRGGVIPNIENVAEHGDEPVSIPDACPSCGAAAFRDSDVLRAEHDASCRVFRLKELEHFISTIRADGFGEKIIAQIYDAGLVSTTPDFFRLTPDKLLPLERVGKKLAIKLVSSIQDKRTLPADVFLRSLGVDELGKHVGGILAQTYGDIEKILAVEAEELAGIHTIGDIIAEKVVAGLAEKEPLIRELLQFVTLTWPQDRFSFDEVPTKGPLVGKSVLFTGAMASMKRDDAQELVVRLGGKAASSVSGKLDLLVLGDKDVERFESGWRSSKLKKAEKLIADGNDLKIVSESEFIAMTDDS